MIIEYIMASLGLLILILGALFVRKMVDEIVYEPRRKAERQRERAEYDNKLFCPHCQKFGFVTTEEVMVNQGISGDKATAALLALSRDQEGVLALAEKGHEIQQPSDLIKDPYVLEFTGLPQSERLLESDLEQALIDKLREFLLELGKGFAFMARQQRITLDGQHYWIDLVFYNRLTRSFVLIDLKVGTLTHQDLGQMQMYVNYYQREVTASDENPPIGIVLCADIQIRRGALGDCH